MSGAAADLWAFSLRTYARPGVEAACLDLQDRRGLDVNLILCACWLGGQGVRLRADRVAVLEAAAAPWRQRAILPLRTLRRALKTALPELLSAGSGLDADAAALRDRVKEVELAAERVEQRLLARLADGWPADAPPGPGTVAFNLARLAGFGPDDEDALLALLEAASPGADRPELDAALSRLTGARRAPHRPPSGGRSGG